MTCFCWNFSLLEDRDTQVVMKALGLMRNLLSGKEVSWFVILENHK